MRTHHQQQTAQAPIEPRAAPRQPERPVRRHQIRTWERFDLTPRAHLLTPGENVLAIEVERKSSDESTLFLVPELGAARPVLHANFRLRSREMLSAKVVSAILAVI